MKRVVVTGMAGITALGDCWADIETALRAGRNGVRRMPEWDYIEALNTRLGAPVDNFAAPAHYPRKTVRSMGRVALMGVRASELALADAGLLGDPTIADGRMGIAYGSSSGSIEPVRVFGAMLDTGSMQGVTSTSYIQMMSHTAAVNIALFFGLKGRVIPTSSACTSGSQGLGYAFEAIRYGRQTLMLAGGAEELSAASAAVFDTLFAASTRNNAPTLTPRPFDRARDGLVVGEGAATLVLEEYEHAKARGAHILAEIARIVEPRQGRIVIGTRRALRRRRQTVVAGHHAPLEVADLVEDAPLQVIGEGVQRHVGYVGAQLAILGVEPVGDGPRRGQQGAIIGGVGGMAAIPVGAEAADQQRNGQQDGQPAQQPATQAARRQLSHRWLPAGSPGRGR